MFTTRERKYQYPLSRSAAAALIFSLFLCARFKAGIFVLISPRIGRARRAAGAAAAQTGRAIDCYATFKTWKSPCCCFFGCDFIGHRRITAGEAIIECPEGKREKWKSLFSKDFPMWFRLQTKEY